MEIKRNIKFEVERRKDNKGFLITDNVPIRCVVTFNGNRVTFFSGQRIDMDKFNPDKEKVKNGCYNKSGMKSSYINAGLDMMRSDIQDIFKRYETLETPLTAELLKKEYKDLSGKVETKRSNGFFELFDEFMEYEGKRNEWTDRTRKKHEGMKNLIMEFDPKIKNFDEKKVQDFIEHMRTKRGHRNTTVLKYIKVLNQFTLWAEIGGHLPNNVKNYKPKLKGSDGRLKPVVYLTWDELLKVFSLDIKEEYLQRVRDVFCFCCFTGLRYSDVHKLTKSSVTNGKIEIVTLKDVDKIYIEINKYSQAIIEKYKDIDGERLLPVLSNQKYNKYLKTLGELAELNEEITDVWFIGNKRHEKTYKKSELLSTHVGRKTFVVNALTLGISPMVIMKWTGHSDIKAMRPYMDIVDKLKESEMDKFNKKE